VGLTGGIACGKTEVARRLAAGSVPILDLDRLAHELMAPGLAAHGEIVSAFGERVLGPGQAIDRRILAGIVFGDPQARARLNEIVHPKVREAEAAHARGLAAAGASVLVTEAALLVESGLHLRFDRLVVVTCGPDAQLARLRARDGLDEATARSRIRAQMPVELKQRFAHYTVDTGGSPDDTREAAEALGRFLAEVAAARPRPITLDRSRALGGLAFGETDASLGVGEGHSHEHVSQAQSLTTSAAKEAGERAYKMAGLGPKDMDVAELYDCFTPVVIIELEDLGFCPKGEGGRFVEGGRIELGGELPINTHGGLMSHCHPGHPGSLFSITEAVHQLRGECGPRQVKDAELALVHGQGGIMSTHCTMILGKERG
jgi:dephospho-CoA kinase